MRERVAMICPVKDCKTRYFGDLNWKCPQHGQAVRQPNKPYVKGRWTDGPRRINV